MPKSRTLPTWALIALATFVALATAAAPEADEPRTAEVDKVPEIILYQTSWCGYCRKARNLLEELDADFVNKDIEQSEEAAREYREKGRGYRGIPLVVYGEEVLRGYSEQRIREMVRDQKERAASERKTETSARVAAPLAPDR